MDEDAENVRRLRVSVNLLRLESRGSNDQPESELTVSGGSKICHGARLWSQPAMGVHFSFVSQGCSREGEGSSFSGKKEIGITRVPTHHPPDTVRDLAKEPLLTRGKGQSGGEDGGRGMTWHAVLCVWW